MLGDGAAYGLCTAYQIQDSSFEGDNTPAEAAVIPLSFNKGSLSPYLMNNVPPSMLRFLNRTVGLAVPASRIADHLRILSPYSRHPDSDR